MSKKLVLIDGHSILNRAFFGLPDLTNSQGIHTNAVYGFLNIMFKILEEEKPDYLTVAFDVHAPTFRHKMYEVYKGTRKPMADELRQQVPLIKEMLTAMGVTIVEKEGYEADDILGTLSVLGEKQGMEVKVISGDRDLLQLATEHVQIRIPKTKRTGTEIENYYAADVKEAYRVTPKEFIDVKALMGDTADNIPGVPGIGQKGATDLIEKFESIENAYAQDVAVDKKLQKLKDNWELAKLSKTLATIITDVPLDYSFEDSSLENTEALYTQEAYVLCKQLEFKNLLPRFAVDKPNNQVQEHFCRVTDKEQATKIWKKWQGKPFAFHIVPGQTNVADTDGQLSLFEEPSQNLYLAMAVTFSQEEIYFFEVGKKLTSVDLNNYLREAIADAGKQEVVCLDLKSQLMLMELLEPENWEAYITLRKRFFDVMVAAYLINPLISEYLYDDIAKDYLGQILPSKVDLLGKKKPEEDMEAAMKWACYESYVSYMSHAVFKKMLQEKKMDALFSDLEMPLVFVLYDMQKAGISMDAQALKEYGEQLKESILELEKKIYEGAGEEFNINSPKQLGIILFEKLQMPYGKKTKTGYSTSAEVLDKLSMEYPLVKDILEYRQLTKLKSTYADGLLNYVKEDGKIHTTFNQTVTATGRLSSTDPNLQNIPIRIELGKMIRKVFFPENGNVFIDSDYSQIELRILAHMSGDEMLIKAFRDGQDIHRTTASQVFHVPFEEVTSLQRRNAKAVNFGIVYGISAFGLAKDLDIERKEAQQYIDQYFTTYPKIKEFLDNAVTEAKEHGYTTTMFGRIRPIPELSSSNFMQRQFGERVAMNAPIQGTAADVIKVAMVNVHDRLAKEKLNAKLLLQVHDELLIEAKEEEKEQVIAILEEEMKKAAAMAVELEVDTQSGFTWYDAH